MKQNRLTIISAVIAAALLAVFLTFGSKKIFSMGALQEETAKEARSAAPPKIIVPNKPKYVRGIHLTSWVTGSAKFRASLSELLEKTELNTVVVDIKEYEGEVFIPGVQQAEQLNTYNPAMPDIEQYLAELKAKGIYTIARLVVFKDNRFPARRPDAAVRTPTGEVWTDRRGNTWIDPYNKAGWDYNLAVAERAIDLGFEEIQFDYIRFPSDGNTATCRYSVRHSSITASAAITDFLKEANRRLKPRGVNLSIDVFGLTTTSPHDMGIGQMIVDMTQWVDYVSPMVYPSHYARGEYGIPDPNRAPYKTVYLGLKGAKKRLGESAGKLRPYLQDFTLGHRYGADEVRAQIQASYDNDIGDWLLWNPRCVYTRSALREKKYAGTYEKTTPAQEVVLTQEKTAIKPGKPETDGEKPGSADAPAAAPGPSSPEAD